jgi:lactoylglutathione lyase
MQVEHIAIWTSDIERLKDFYIRYFGGVSNSMYTNTTKQFSSYFISFGGSARLEIMQMPGVLPNSARQEKQQQLGLAHLAFKAHSMQEVEQMAAWLSSDGYPILSGPRKTGDGYYEFETLDPDGNRIEVTFALNS